MQRFNRIANAGSHMWIAIVRIDLIIPGAYSLKDRRQAVKSLKERLRHRFDAACAEVGDLESWNRASLGISLVSNEKQALQEMVEEIVRYSRNDSNVQLANSEQDFLHYE